MMNLGAVPKDDGLIADFSDGRALLRAIVIAEALAPPIALRDPNAPPKGESR